MNSLDRMKLRTQLAQHEGRREFVYDDANGKPIKEDSYVRGIPTIGVGRNLSQRGLAPDEIDYLLDNDIEDSLVEARKLKFFSGLDDVRQALVVELVFNLGFTRLLGFKQFLKNMAAGKYVEAGAELKDSAWYRQVGALRGDRLIKQCESGVWQT